LRRDPATRTIPFIFLTGRADEADRLRARKIGSDDYLTKPCPLERLVQSVDMLMDRIEQARKLPLAQIGRSGKIEQVDLLDMIQTLEMEQQTGALVLSHGERTATLYFREGVIVQADIQSPKREEPLFVLLGWKTGTYLFLPDVLPERMPITASLANLLIQDLHTMEQHEHLEATTPDESPSATDVPTDLPAARVLAQLDELARRVQRAAGSAPRPHLLRILVVGQARSGKSELIQGLVHDLSGSRWTAVGVEETQGRYRTDFGRVMISREVVLHLIAVRAEKRFWPVWEQLLPGSLAALILLNPSSGAAKAHLRAFLQARAALAPSLPVQLLVPPEAPCIELPDLSAMESTTGLITEPAVRLTLLDQLLEECLLIHSPAQ
ncbi:MAG: DUF4388 domain-containing protein, partial [Nitrospirales bacterium]